MRVTYDPETNIAYIRFLDDVVEVETHVLSDSVHIDLAPDGSIYGIELMNANEQLRAGDDGFVVVTHPATGEELRLPLAA
jgi:uncharacterized protein YuzE